MTATADIEMIAPRVPVLFQPRGGVGNFFEKVRAGKGVTVAYFGGSITAAPGWRVKTLDAFRAAYPAASFREVHAAIGGTGSDLGVFRMDRDVLEQKPDLVFVEFAVNDGDAPIEKTTKSMEGIVRKIWAADPLTDIVFVYTLHTNFLPFLDDGKLWKAATVHETIAEHYGIPAINVALRVYNEAIRGRLIYTRPVNVDGAKGDIPEGKILFSEDECHPTDTAHELYAETVEEAFAQMETMPASGPHELRTPVHPQNWERAKMLPLDKARLTGSWRKLDATDPRGGFAERMGGVWEANTPGDRVDFRFRGTTALLYDVLGPDGGEAVVIVDNEPALTIPRFDKHCTWHRLATLPLYSGDDTGVHQVTVEVGAHQPDRSIATVHEPGPYDPAKYQGTVLRPGAILLVGDLV